MKSKKLKKHIGRVLKELRIRNGAKRKELADILEISVKEYRAIEVGRKNILISKAVVLAKKYSVSLDCFVINALH